MTTTAKRHKKSSGVRPAEEQEEEEEEVIEGLVVCAACETGSTIRSARQRFLRGMARFCSSDMAAAKRSPPPTPTHPPCRTPLLRPRGGSHDHARSPPCRYSSELRDLSVADGPDFFVCPECCKNAQQLLAARTPDAPFVWVRWKEEDGAALGWGPQRENGVLDYIDRFIKAVAKLLTACGQDEFAERVRAWNKKDGCVPLSPLSLACDRPTTLE